MRRRTITVGGEERSLPSSDARRFEVVRGILMGGLTLREGARKLRIRNQELARLVDGAKRAVIEQLGEAALERARRAHHGAMSRGC